MIFDSFINSTRDRIAKRMRYNRMVADIQALTDRDLSDMRASRTEMLHQAYREIYG